jgi:pimeloyl-ACP methyl ester carboxylesterase
MTTHVTRRTVVVRSPAGNPLGDPDPTESERRGVVVTGEVDATTIGIVGWSTAGPDALALAAANPHVARLVLVAVPYEPAKIEVELSGVTAKTLLLFGAQDPATGSQHGRNWQKALPSARLEMVPDGAHDLVGRMWARILAHVAPRGPAK